MTNDLANPYSRIKVWLDWGTQKLQPSLAYNPKRTFRYVFKRADGIMQIGGIHATSRANAIENLRSKYKLPPHITLELVYDFSEL